MNNYKILIAEDDELLRYMLGFTLRKAGYTVIECENGKQAINSFNAQHIHAVITDLNLPYVNGLEVISFIRKDANSQVPIFVLSAYDADNVRQEELELGANEYLAKPFNTQNLLILIEKYINNKMVA